MIEFFCAAVRPPVSVEAGAGRAEMEPEDIGPAEQASFLVTTKIEFDAATAVVLIVRPVNTIVFGPAGSCTLCGGVCICCCDRDPKFNTTAE